MRSKAYSPLESIVWAPASRKYRSSPYAWIFTARIWTLSSFRMAATLSLEGSLLSTLAAPIVEPLARPCPKPIQFADFLIQVRKRSQVKFLTPAFNAYRAIGINRHHAFYIPPFLEAVLRPVENRVFAEYARQPWLRKKLADLMPSLESVQPSPPHRSGRQDEKPAGLTKVF